MSLDQPASPFDEVIDRRGTHCSKWDRMESLYGVSPQEGLAMWVADMDFRPPQVVSDALQRMVDHGIYGYFGNDGPYKEAICWWHQTRNGWMVDPNAIFTTHGLVNGTALCIDAYTRPGDGVILMTPVYHAFHRVVKTSGRELVQMPLALHDGRYWMDLEDWEGRLNGRERMLILCSPHNPGGRVWTRAELEALAGFCRKHDLILMSDEIHSDLLFPGQTHQPMALIEGVEDRLVMLTAATKTFNIAGAHVGNVIVPDEKLREIFAGRMAAMGISPNGFGLHMVTAAYSPAGAAWVDALCPYLEGNRQMFDAAVNAIPGVRSMPLEATYLSWVDFAGTGMTPEEFTRRVQQDAKIAVNHGETFGIGGETCLRFNIAAPRSLIAEACARMTRAFSDLQ